MIQIPPSLSEPGVAQVPRRVEGGGVQSVPAVQADKAGTNPDVILNLPNPVLEASTDSMRPRDAAQKAAATQIDRPEVSGGVRQASGGADIAVDVRQGLSSAGLPERLLRLLMQLEQLSAKSDRPVMWPAAEQLRAARPDVALVNLRQALANSMLFEVQRLQSRLVPSTSVAQATPGRSTDDAGLPPGGALLARPAQALTGPPAVTDPVSAPLEAGHGLGWDALPEGGGQAPLVRAGAVPERNVQPRAAQPDAPEKQVMEHESADQVVQSRKGPETSAGDDEAQTPTALGLVSDEDVTEASLMTPSVWRRTGETLTAESSSIRDAVRLLLHGELRWQGELSPGVFAQLDREDFWEEDHQAPGALVKGVTVKVDLDLPHLGRVQVRGMFVKDSVRINVLPHDRAHTSLSSELQSLKERLQARGLEYAQVRLLEGEDG